MLEIMQAPGAAAQNAATAAENAQLDAQLELAAKKAALRSMEAQGGGPASADVPPGTPLPPGASRTTVVTEKDGKVTVLENPTVAQLRAAGIGARGSEWNPLNTLDAKQVTAISLVATSAVVAVIWMVLHYVRGGRRVTAAPNTAAMAHRMSRLENAIETVAVEVERVSESQRYMSRMLSEGAAMPVAGVVQQGEPVRRNNGEG